MSKRLEAFTGFAKQIKKSQRIILSEEKKITPRSESQLLDGRVSVGKPNGLWYSCGNSWLEWCLAEDFGFGSYIHSIKLDLSAMKVIKNVRGFDTFSAEYGMAQGEWYEKFLGICSDELKKFVTPSFRLPDYIDWERVAQKYAGIEINPYLWKRRLTGGLWYYGMDCASGCVWDASIVRSVDLIAYYDSKHGVIRLGHENFQKSS